MLSVTRFLFLIVAACSLSATVVLAQAPAKTKHVGYLVWSSPSARGSLEQSLLDGMKQEGYVEGKNLLVERRYVDGGTFDEVRAAARELAALNLDAIVSTCSYSTAAAKEATSTSRTPVVMAFVSDPVGQGLIASFRNPGGNITGLSSQAEDTIPKMLQYISQVMPPGTRIAVLYHATNPVHPRLWDRLQQAAKARGATLVRIDFSDSGDLVAAFDKIGEQRAGALLVLPDDNTTFNVRKLLVALVNRQRIPAIFGPRDFVDIGGLMSYGANMGASYRQTSKYLDKVLAGVKPAGLAVEQPTRFEFVMNLGAAKVLGVTIPQDLAVLADDVVRDAPAASTYVAPPAGWKPQPSDRM